MNTLVVAILGFAAFAAASPSWGHQGPVDTPEVAAAKAAHLAAVAQASGRGAWGGGGAWNGGWNGGWNRGEDDGQWKDDTQQWNNNNWNGGWNSWNGNDDGQWRDDTQQWNNGGWNQWNGRGEDGDDGQWRDDTNLWADRGQWNQGSGAWGGHGGWNGASWAGHGGLINGETPEVAAAKAAHLAAHAAIAHRHRRSLLAVNPNALPVPLDSWNVALAKKAQLIQIQTEGTRNILGGGIPLALPADTHEVAVGKQAHAIAHATQTAITSGHGIASVGPVAAVAPVAVSPLATAVLAPVAKVAVAPVAIPSVISTHSSVVHSAPLLWGKGGLW